MKAFMDKDFLLNSGTAAELYHNVAKHLPIIDYHCHLDAREIWEDRRFDNITQLWLGGDHYKWRLMRSAGVEERLITGDADDRAKFGAWAKTVGKAIGSPLFHWSHLELKNYFGYQGVLNENTAEEVWNLANAQLQTPDFSARNLIRRSNVEAICTTDDPADELLYHRKLREEGFPVKVLPSFRPDRALGIDKPDYLSYLKRLGNIQNYDELKNVLIARLDYFVSLGCRVCDHGMESVPFAPANEQEVSAIFDRRLSGTILSSDEEKKFRTDLLLFLGRAYAKRGMVMQLHYGVRRDNSSRLFAALGADAGGDSIGNRASVSELACFLDALDRTNELPKTILYSLEPSDNAAIETVMGAFQSGGVKGKLQHGSAWWFNDHKDGIRAHLSSLAAEGFLPSFVGMLTDSRSFLSYARHEYFRRILCDYLGSLVENGEYPKDMNALSEITAGICYDNAKEYFG